MKPVCAKIVVVMVLVAVVVGILIYEYFVVNKLNTRAKSGSCIQSSNYSTNCTFRACINKSPETFVPDWSHNPEEVQFGRRLKPFIKNNLGEILGSTQFPNRTFECENGFVLSVLRAYNSHHNLVIRPDDVWAAIMTQFSFYLNGHAGKFRHKFVDSSRGKDLVVKVPGNMMRSSTRGPPPYHWFVKEITKKIHANLVSPLVKDWILPGFSTTTENDLVTVGVIFMGTLKKYFDYTAKFRCGIPWITLEGTVEDWKDIYKRLEKLKEYKLDKWYELLEPILNQFVSARKGNVDVGFWETICDFRGGSGTNLISGWISTFAVFNEQGDWQATNSDSTEETLRPMAHQWPTLDVLKVPSGMVQVDVKIDDNNGAIHESIMLGGHMGMELLQDEMTLKPSLGWILAVKRKFKGIRIVSS